VDIGATTEKKLSGTMFVCIAHACCQPTPPHSLSLPFAVGGDLSPPVPMVVEPMAVDLVSHHSQLVVDSVTNRQPVELAQQRICICVAPPRCLQNNPSGVVLHAL